MPILEKIKNGIYLIAEMSANHGGNLDQALKIVKAAKTAGADCVKIQTYTPDMMTIKSHQKCFQIQEGLWSGECLYDLYDKAQTPLEWHEAIKNACMREEVDFLSTPFDRTAVDFLEELEVSFYKIASFELVDIPLIEYTASKGKLMILSCGMGSPEEISEAVDACKRQGNSQIILLKCCSEYPARYQDMNLSVLLDMQRRFSLPVGLSDHTLGSLAAIVGVSLGACVVEKHFCLSWQIETPDSAFSMEPQEFAAMAKELRKIKEIKGNPSYLLSKEETNSLKFRRSIFAVKDILKGESFSEQNIRVIRPSDGIKPKYYSQLIGKAANRKYLRGEPLEESVEVSLI